MVDHCGDRGAVDEGRELMFIVGGGERECRGLYRKKQRKC
jgi:hypothetical protein